MTIRSLDLNISRRIALEPKPPADMQIADVLASNARAGYHALQLLLLTHSFNRDPTAELAAATAAFTIRITGARLTFTGLAPMQLLLAESHAHASLDLRSTFNKIVQQIVSVGGFSFTYLDYNWQATSSSIISSHMLHGQKPISYDQLVILLDLLQSFDSLFSSISCAYADHSNVHTAAYTPEPAHAAPAHAVPTYSPHPDFAALSSQNAALSSQMAKLAATVAAFT